MYQKLLVIMIQFQKKMNVLLKEVKQENQQKENFFLL
jgi:hypothetical protein